jgi:hypothetical protein
MTIGLAAMLVLGSAASAPASAADRCSTGAEPAAELLSVHETARRAHLEGKAELMAPGTADEVVVVSNGELRMTPKDKLIDFFRGYFARVKYLEWSDSEPPMIHVSPDGAMGWMGVKIRARYVETAKPEAGEKAFRSSWIATYRRVGCEWRMTGNASAVVDE